jgi:hypothetical protein
MAKFIISGDTDTESFTVSVDGVEIPEPTYAMVSVYQDMYDGDPELSFCVESRKRVNGLLTTLTLHASDLKPGMTQEEIIAVMASDRKPKVSRDVAKFFSGKG